MYFFFALLYENSIKISTNFSRKFSKSDEKNSFFSEFIYFQRFFLKKK